jgi:hypothetical protein
MNGLFLKTIVRVRLEEGNKKMIEMQDMLTNSSATSPVQSGLSGFGDYQEFLSFSKSLFQLKQQEYKGLFNVLLKLQSVGQDAVQTMMLLKDNPDEHDCYELIRFMIQFDRMDMDNVKTMLSS